MSYEDVNNQWIFTNEELIKYTPSRFDGFSYEEEKSIRSKAINFISSMGASLRVVQVAIASASVLFHRFYMRRSLKDVHHYEVAAASLFLACKTEECSRHIEDVAKQAIRLCRKIDSIDFERDSVELTKWRLTLISTEEKIISVCCFDIDIEHPYKQLLSYFRDLDCSDELQRASYAFVNDSYRTTLCLTHSPQVIAAAAIVVASKYVKQPLPTDQKPGKNWWDIIGTNIKHIEESGHQILDLYEKMTFESEPIPNH